MRLGQWVLFLCWHAKNQIWRFNSARSQNWTCWSTQQRAPRPQTIAGNKKSASPVHRQHLKRCWQLLCDTGHPVINVILPTAVPANSHEHSSLNNSGKLGGGFPAGKGKGAARSFPSGHTHAVSNDALQIHTLPCSPAKYLCQYHTLSVNAILEALVL